MYFALTNAIKKRFVQVFQDILLEHPIFCKSKVITKFQESEREKTMLLIRSTSGNSQKLSMDNFVRNEISYSILANLQNKICNSIEWVKDDTLNIDNLSTPGIYIVKIIEDKKFVVSPYLSIYSEQLVPKYIQDTIGFNFKNKNINPESEIIYSNDYGEFKRDIDYSIDYNLGLVLFKKEITEQINIFEEDLFCDYQILGQQLGPFDCDYYYANNTAIPGVILAFGDRIKVGDEQAVIIEKEQCETAKVYGGRWQMSVDIITVSQDPDQQERLTDYAVSMFWAQWQDKLVDEGLNVTEFSLTGESEDLELDIPEEYSFTGGISFNVETDWELSFPLITKLRYINLQYGEESFKREMSNINEEKYEKYQYDERMNNSKHQVGIIPSYTPIVTCPNIMRNIK